MKKITLLFSFTTLWLYVAAQTTLVKPVVDARVELMSAVFRLAEAQEYVNNHFASYAKEVDDYFAPMKEHEIIPYIHKLREEYGVGYDAVMDYAIHIEIRNGDIIFDTNVTSDLEARWTKENADEFLALLNDFYKKSNFQTFFDSHNELYETASENFQPVLEEVDFEWFEKFYGTKSDDNYRIILGLLNGGGNYGPSLEYKDGKRDVFSVMGTWQTDSLGNPAYSPRILQTLIHEFNHSYCNRLIDEHIDALLPQARKFHALDAEKLLQQAYGTAETMLYEILVRTCVLQYFNNEFNSDKQLSYTLNMLKSSGFMWIDALYNALTTYQNNRSQYPTLACFMPEIIKLQNSLNPKKIKKEFDKKCGKIIGCNIKNGAKNVDYTIDHITVKFNKSMFDGNNGASYGPKGKDFFPDFDENKEAIWTEKEWTIFVNLKPDTEYSISFPAQFFMTKDRLPVQNTYILEFRTRK
ncbi:MAG: DUF4932 domain-containing protein [Cytophagaceae bacterium]|nr:DUF4932 domain-containing protein [Cytophagaceae bacterium]